MWFKNFIHLTSLIFYPIMYQKLILGINYSE
nr:MAG TPA: hypothetical protein [Bacteriophage sp.]